MWSCRDFSQGDKQIDSLWLREGQAMPAPMERVAEAQEVLGRPGLVTPRLTNPTPDVVAPAAPHLQVDPKIPRIIAESGDIFPLWGHGFRRANVIAPSCATSHPTKPSLRARHAFLSSGWVVPTS